MISLLLFLDLLFVFIQTDDAFVRVTSGTNYTENDPGVLLGSVVVEYASNNSEIYDEKRRHYAENEKEDRDYADIFNSVLTQIQNEKCVNDVVKYVNGLKNFSTWAVEMFDSSSKFQSGLLSGNIRDLGDFDECLAVRASDTTSDYELFKGQYCLTQVYIETDFHNPSVAERVDYLLHRMTAGRRNIEDTKRKGLAYFPSFSKFEVAVCIPSSCTWENLQTAGNYLLREVIHTPEIQVHIHVDENTCYTQQPLHLHARDFVFFYVVGRKETANSDSLSSPRFEYLWKTFCTTLYFYRNSGALSLVLVALIIAATLYEAISKRKQEQEMFTKEASYGEALTSFSLTSNVNKLVSLEAPQDSIKCVDAMRVLTIFWVILTHKVFCMTQEAWTNKVFLIEAVKDFEKMPILNSMLDVDTFFLIGGLVRSYNLLKELEQQKFDYFISFIQRYLRLTPAYVGMIAFFATVSVYFGSGPYWHTGMEVQSQMCRENWIWNVLYVNNYVDSNRKCMLQTWYLSADMHLFLFSPILIYPLWRWPKWGILLMTAYVAVSVAIPFFTIFVNNLPGIQYSSVSDSLLSDYAQYIYYPTHQRMSPYFAGIILGYILHKSRNEKISIPKIASLLFWGLSLASLAAVIFGPYKLIQFDHEYDALESSIYGGIHRLAWGVAVAWTIFACHKGYGGMVNKCLSARIFRPLSRLSYCMFLTHLGILHYGVSKMRTAKHMDEYSIIHDFTGDIVLTVIASVVLHFCLESPFLNITRIITRKIAEWKQKRRRKRRSNMIKPVI